MSVSAPTGFARAAQGPGLGTRLRAARGVVVVLVVFAALITVLVLTRSDVNAVPLSTHNPAADGTRAVAQVLREHSVTVREVDRLGAAHITDPAHTTLVIADAGMLQGFQARSIAEYPGDVVVWGRLGVLSDALGWDLATTPATPGVRDAHCEDATAQAAGTMLGGDSALGGQLPPGAVGCFEAAGTWLMVTVPDGERTITVMANADVPTNGTITAQGHAALALRTLGTHPTLVWYLGSELDGSVLTWTRPTTDGATPPGSITAVPDFLPAGTGTAFYALALALGVVVLWRARRFGPLVTEALPVIIRASEATRGRARLYRAASASGRAGASLRAAAATRMARRLGVPRHAHAVALVDAISGATGRPREHVTAVLYGPLPATEQAMMDLAAALDQLEGEVHQS